MASVQIAIDAAYVTKAEFLRRTGIKPRTFDKLLHDGDIPIREKQGTQRLVLVNMVKWAEEAALQQV
ncbi:Rha family transcriptional regulator [Vibrio aestuarianus]|uniref:Rha family transcriptional regulator n=1 Tax=Vibrio aestuarianus TaxID=28171 RepID=UPI0015938079|nr:Rha family transcriptional regulator [Vibrio aestuarianus]MDE1235803.1 Rha family transcriptional regulator [Vibrio aestuarianus]MDE1246641.1 Rha family transcriptional regulator [Vibrio aestuarianus]MDE1316320.1 Rha family transcriptional regulator [Vibrio aestuarianus]NGZ63796.1 Rha family transcriptional regulator [Vibrio aestuarianus subsp. cardii]CAH8242441.1 Rha family transcriptional regulator [Vibrio aestuarianus]